MTIRSYRLTVLAGALSWFLAGLHMPVLHELTEPEPFHHWGVLVITVVLVLLGITAIVMLLRTRPTGGAGDG